MKTRSRAACVWGAETGPWRAPRRSAGGGGPRAGSAATRDFKALIEALGQQVAAARGREELTRRGATALRL